MQCELKAGGSDIFTIVPIQSEGKAAFAPIGLTNMLNTGGAISAWTADQSSVSFKVRHSFDWSKADQCVFSLLMNSLSTIDALHSSLHVNLIAYHL